MLVTELNREQLIELKTNYYVKEKQGISYGEVIDIDNIINDEEVFEKYKHIDFVVDDFFCN